jgi:predicted DNA-binding antitoxin AbrB/MazE fold protein
MQIEAIYQDGKFIPISPINLEESNKPFLLEIIVQPNNQKTINNLALELKNILGSASKTRPAATKEEDRELLAASKQAE